MTSLFIPLYLGPGLGSASIVIVIIVLAIVGISLGYLAWYYIKKATRRKKK